MNIFLQKEKDNFAKFEQLVLIICFFLNGFHYINIAFSSSLISLLEHDFKCNNFEKREIWGRNLGKREIGVSYVGDFLKVDSIFETLINKIQYSSLFPWD